MSAILLPPDDRLLRRVLSDFRAAPGLRLTLPQAQRLWGLDRATCEAVLAHLTDTHVLARDTQGRFKAHE